MKLPYILLSATPLALWSSVASAGFLGQQVTIDNRYPTADTVDSVLGTGVVDADGFTATFVNLGITVSDTQVTIEPLTSTSPGVIFFAGNYNGFGISETGASPAIITGFTINPSTNVYDSAFAGFDASRVTFDGSHLFINMQDIRITNPIMRRVVLDLQFAQPGAVPEPETWAMMILGFGVAGQTMRRRRQNWRIAKTA